jgi:hypothetical protein
MPIPRDSDLMDAIWTQQVEQTSNRGKAAGSRLDLTPKPYEPWVGRKAVEPTD